MLRMLDAALERQGFIAGDEYSIADITTLDAIDFMKPARLERPQSLPNLARWHAQVSTRPSAQA
jgi:glutathione S-transferase